MRKYKIYYKRLMPETHTAVIRAKDGYEAEEILARQEMEEGYRIECDHQEYMGEAE